MVDVRTTYRGIVVAVGGPPHSGKSVFVAELYRQLLSRTGDRVFLQRACPDGEGMWSAEADPALVQKLRRKGTYSSDFVNHVIESIEAIARRKAILLVDLGGWRSEENGRVLGRATHCILLSSREDELPRWRRFAEGHGCKTLALFGSKLVTTRSGQSDRRFRSTLDLRSAPVRGSFVNLSRDGSSPLSYRLAVQEFADWLVAFAAER
jgi:CRISPR-associated protein Csx3